MSRVVIIPQLSTIKAEKYNPSATHILPGWFGNEYHYRLFPGTAIIDLSKENGQITNNESYLASTQQSIHLNDLDYKATADKLYKNYALVCFQKLDFYGTSNEKIVKPKGITVSPIFVNKDAFKDHESLMRLFEYERRFFMLSLLRRITTDTISFNDYDYLKINLEIFAKMEVLKKAYNEGLGPEYLEFHNRVYPDNSQNRAIHRQNSLLKHAMALPQNGQAKKAA